MSANVYDATVNDLQIHCSTLLPNQIGIDHDSCMRKDLPFDTKTLSTKEKHNMCSSTLAPPKKQESDKLPSPSFYQVGHCNFGRNYGWHGSGEQNVKWTRN